MEYPALVYRSSGGSSFEHELVQNDDERAQKLDEGWHETVPEALAAAGSLSFSADRAQRDEGERKSKADAEAGAAEAARIAEDQARKREDEQRRTDDSDPPTREELEKQASELGIKFDGRNSNASLSRMIEDALNA